MTIPTLQYLISELIEHSQSGHPGAAISLTQLFTILYRHLRYDPDDSLWIDRDALILSNGHACILQYLFLHLSNRLSFNDLLEFRTLNSRTPGHPEVHTPGVEVCTGPLGQGLVNGVGFGLSQRLVNGEGITIVVFGDGCYMEGISHEAFGLCSLYGPRIIFIYDCNGVTIDGSTELALNEDYRKRFEGYGFNVKVCEGYENVELILKTKIDFLRKKNESFGKNTNEEIADKMKKRTDTIDIPDNKYKSIDDKDDKNVSDNMKKNTETDVTDDLFDKRILMLVLKNKIASGTKLEGNAKTHGAPLGRDIVDDFAKSLNINLKELKIPDSIYDEYEIINSKNREIRKKWNESMMVFKKNKSLINPETPFFNRIQNFNPLVSRKYYYNIDESCLDHIFLSSKNEKIKISTRKALNNALRLCSSQVPFLLSGSADLTPSCLTKVEDSVCVSSHSTEGSYLHYGVREHGMFGMMNGFSAHGVFLPLGSTFLNFITYGFPAVRLAALSNFPGIFVMTHDSIGLGEDGPTHQPIEVLPLLRATPNLIVIRPCDQTETFFALKYAIVCKRPVVLSLSRQDIQPCLGTDYNKCMKGAYKVYESRNSTLTVIASGSEVPLAVEVAQKMGGDAVSMLSFELFDEQSYAYKNKLLKGLVVSIEASSTFGWHKYAKLCIGIDKFGKSGKGSDVMRDYGFTVEDVVEKIKQFMKNNGNY